MQKYYILVIAVLLFNLPKVHAAILKDSVGVENVSGKKVILHKVVAKDTYYSIGRRYNISPKLIIAYNDNKYLALDIIIKVPTEQAFNSGKAIIPGISTSKEEQPVSTAAGSIIEHAVKPKENLNMLAEKYGTTVNEIKRLNELKTINLRIGQLLKIPVKEGFSETEETSSASTAAIIPQPVTPPPAAEKVVEKPVEKKIAAKPPVMLPPAKTTVEPEFIEHIVGSNETIYSIATRYNLTMDQLKAKNDLKDNALTVGQHLLIKGQYPAKPVYNTPAANSADSNSDTTGLKNPSLRYAPSRYGLNQMDEKGTAVWISDADLDPTKMLVLHRTAPIGSVMKITNPMTNRSTFAKVVGKFTENETTKDVIIVMTKAVADALGAIDKRFFCNLTYSGQQENEQ